MPVPVNKKPKRTTGAKKLNVPIKSPKGAKKVGGAGAGPSVKTTKKTHTIGKKATGPGCSKPVQSEAIKTKQRKTAETIKRSGKANTMSGTAKNQDLRKKKVNMAKIHPEVDKLVKILKSSIKELSDSNLDSIPEVKNEIEESSDRGAWGLDYESNASSYECDTANYFDSDVSIVADTYDISDDNFSSCSDNDEYDDQNAYSSDEMSSCDEYFTDEYSISDYDADSDNDSCSGCEKRMTSTASKRSLMEQTVDVKPDGKPKLENKSTLLEDASKLQKMRIKKSTNTKIKQEQPTFSIEHKLPKIDVKPKNNADSSTKKSSKSLKKTASVNKSGQSKKKTFATRPATSKKPMPLTDLTNACSIRVAKTNNPKVIIKKPYHAAKPMATNATTMKHSSSASTSSGYSTLASSLMTSKSSIKKSAIQCSSPFHTDQQSKPGVIAPRARRSVGVSCHLPDANSTFQNNWSEKLWRY